MEALYKQLQDIFPFGFFFKLLLSSMKSRTILVKLPNQTSKDLVVCRIAADRTLCINYAK